ncbi:hypothetical protein CPB85DRAFT_705686 [Mucidula mucida]|nr:hypothetical protein CPB85DRAFT_705686 [Mucidula mucida]
MIATPCKKFNPDITYARQSSVRRWPRTISTMSSVASSPTLAERDQRPRRALHPSLPISVAARHLNHQPPRSTKEHQRGFRHGTKVDDIQEAAPWRTRDPFGRMVRTAATYGSARRLDGVVAHGKQACGPCLMSVTMGRNFGYESASLASLVSKSRNNLHQPPPLALYRRQSFCEDALDIPKS